MNTNNILQADLLDIIFENRNKDYGAYELRKNYYKLLKKSMVIVATFLLVTISAPIIASMFEKPIVIDKPFKEEVKITQVEMPHEPLEKIEPIKVDPIEVEVNTVINTIPEIVEAVNVRVEDLPPTKEDLKDHQSGITNHDGETHEVNTIATINDGHGTDIQVIPEEKHPDPVVEEVFGSEDITQSPEYPGGEEELMAYLSNNIKYPNRAVETETQGRVVLGFIVDKNGEIDEIKVLRGIGYGCDEEAIRVVNKMPKWKPGKNNGKAVKVYFNLPITFEIK